MPNYRVLRHWWFQVVRVILELTWEQSSSRKWSSLLLQDYSSRFSLLRTLTMSLGHASILGHTGLLPDISWFSPAWPKKKKRIKNVEENKAAAPLPPHKKKNRHEHRLTPSTYPRPTLPPPTPSLHHPPHPISPSIHLAPNHKTTTSQTGQRSPPPLRRHPPPSPRPHRLQPALRRPLPLPYPLHLPPAHRSPSPAPQPNRRARVSQHEIIQRRRCQCRCRCRCQRRPSSPPTRPRTVPEEIPPRRSASNRDPPAPDHRSLYLDKGQAGREVRLHPVLRRHGGAGAARPDGPVETHAGNHQGEMGPEKDPCPGRSGQAKGDLGEGWVRRGGGQSNQLRDGRKLGAVGSR